MWRVAGIWVGWWVFGQRPRRRRRSRAWRPGLPPRGIPRRQTRGSGRRGFAELARPEAAMTWIRAEGVRGGVRMFADAQVGRAARRGSGKGAPRYLVTAY